MLCFSRKLVQLVLYCEKKDAKQRRHIQSSTMIFSIKVHLMVSLLIHQLSTEYSLLLSHKLNFYYNNSTYSSSFPTFYKLQQSNAVSYPIHTKGHDILANASLPKEMIAFSNVGNQGSCLKFNVVALNIEYRMETIPESMLSRSETIAILMAHDRETQVLSSRITLIQINVSIQ